MKSVPGLLFQTTAATKVARLHAETRHASATALLEKHFAGVVPEAASHANA
jgi:hypothetical protein